MKLNGSFVTRQFKDTYVITGTENVSFKGVVNGNSTTAFIVECLKDDTTRDTIVEKMLENFRASREVITEDVDKVLDALRSIGAIEE